MAKSKPRKNKSKSVGSQPGYGANIGQTSSRTNLIAGAVAIVIAVGGGYFWWTGKQADEQSAAVVQTLADAGQGALAQVRSVPSQGNGHLPAGATKNYVEPFPTSGDHSSTPVNAGFYDSEMPKINLVHSMEHGNVVIYYDAPGDEAMQMIRDWTSLYTGFWDGVVATRSPGLGETVVLTAWTKLLRLDSFNAAGAAAFLDQYRGRGPENQVR